MEETIRFIGLDVHEKTIAVAFGYAKLIQLDEFGITKRDRDSLLVNVQADKSDSLFHDPSPMHEARRRSIRRNPRHLHTVRPVTPVHIGHGV